MRMKSCCCKAVLFCICVCLAAPVFAEEGVLEQSKTKTMENIDALLHGLHKTRECVSGAKSEIELEQCRETTKMKRFEQVQQMLFEMGMSMEERRMQRFMQDK